MSDGHKGNEAMDEDQKLDAAMEAFQGVAGYSGSLYREAMRAALVAASQGAGSQAIHIAWMGDVEPIKAALKLVQIDRQVAGENMGPMGATQILTFRGQGGLMYEEHSSMGGVSLYLVPPKEPGK